MKTIYGPLIFIRKGLFNMKHTWIVLAITLYCQTINNSASLVLIIMEVFIVLSCII
jgi:hypothetical protein